MGAPEKAREKERERERKVEGEGVYGGVRVVKRTCERGGNDEGICKSSDLYESPSFG